MTTGTTCLVRRGMALLVVVLLAGALACSGGGPGLIVFHLSLANLPSLAGQQSHYEGFALVNGVPFSTGTFVIDASTTPASVTSPDGLRHYGTVDDAVFGPSITGIGAAFPFIQTATHFFITVEPDNDSDPLPSANAVMAGTFNGRTCDLASTGSADPVLAARMMSAGDLTAATATAVLVNPTAGAPSGTQGLWFTTDATGAVPGLVLPPLTGAWTYEAFVQPLPEDGAVVPVSLGKFTDPAQFDRDAFSTLTRGAANVGFNAPGQDFINTVVFPAIPVLDLANGDYTVQITVEPVQDNAVTPFPLVVLSGAIPTNAVDANHVSARDVVLVNGAAQLPSLGVTVVAGDVVVQATPTRALRPLGPTVGARDGQYELWAVVNGTAERAGAFLVDGSTTPAMVTSPDALTVFGTVLSFTLNAGNTGLGAAFPAAALAAQFFVTVQPQGDPVAAFVGPSVVAGGAAGGAATLITAGTAAHGLADFTFAAGTFITRTPTNDDGVLAADDQHGVWFRSLASATPSLILPTLPTDWTYQAWVVSTSTQVATSLGRFRRVDRPDDDALTFAGRGTVNSGFTVPGQDFVTPVPTSSIPAMDLTIGHNVFVTIQPVPDNGNGPSNFVVFFGLINPPPFTDGGPTPSSPFSVPNVFAPASGHLTF